MRASSSGRWPHGPIPRAAYHVWDLIPFEARARHLDSLSLDSPLLVPLFARTSIVPGPNRFRSLDIPVVRGGIIEGGRVIRSGGHGVGGVTPR